MFNAFKKQDFEKALTIGISINQKTPNDFDVLLGIGKSYNLLHNYEKAIPFLENALHCSKQDWQYAWSHIELM